MKRLIGIALGVVATTNVAIADPVSSQMEIAQLVKMVENLNEQLEYARKTLDVQEQLKEMQQLEVVREVADGGAQLFQLASEIEETEDILNSFESPDEQLMELKSDVQGYLELYRQASNEDEAVRALKQYSYALSRLDDQYWLGMNPNDPSESPHSESLYHFTRLVNDVERLQVLRKSQEANQVAVSEGVTASEAARIQATDTNTMLSLLIAQRERTLVDEADRARIEEEEQQVYEAILGPGVE